MFELIPFDRHFRTIADPFKELDELERSFFGRGNMTNIFRTDVCEADNAYTLECELPGFSKEDINIDIENDCLTISAERRMETNDDSKKNYIKRERFYGSFSRSFDVTGIETDAIEAAYNDGILTVTLPKKVETIPASRRLEIK